MSEVKYSQTSPYSKTDTYGFFLDITTFRDIPALAADVVYKIAATYKHRPDLLAYDLYGDSRLWWVFAQRNPNRLGEDPYFDFKTGVGIYIPTLTTLKSVLGI